MHRRAGPAVIFAAAVILSSCASPPEPSSPGSVAVTRHVGEWQGAGNTTIGFISESGRFHVTWETRHEQPPHAGTFRLLVRSAVSGRPIQMLADHRGNGSGSASVDDDPRPYDFVVESANVEWKFSVEEIVAAPAASQRSR